MMCWENVGNSEETILTGKEELNPRSDVKREVPSGAHTIGTLSTILTIIQFIFPQRLSRTPSDNNQQRLAIPLLQL